MSSYFIPARKPSLAIPSITRSEFFEVFITNSLIDDLSFKNHNNKKFSEAEKLYEKVLKIDPNHIICLNYFGVMLAQTNRIDRAEQLFLKANLK